MEDNKGRGTSDKNELLVLILNTEKQFAALEHHWNELSKRSWTGGKSFAWAYNWWKQRGKQKCRSLFIITIWDGTRLIGLAPFYKIFFGLKADSVFNNRFQSLPKSERHNEDHCICFITDILMDRSYLKMDSDRLNDCLKAELRRDNFARAQMKPKDTSSRNL